MESRDLKVMLKQAGLSKKEFAQIVGLSQQTVSNWGCSKNIPRWVESWLELYIDSRRFRELKQQFQEMGICHFVEEGRRI
ncbi:helix-turn-helix domain-containing protein [Wolinella succinogenes]|uniref:HTH cro/C1-type domain-containing protein n=1 Tax=Wolinella succinogenes (strain ATCC 29543 / DSM 1740 / CCUG 13145 / JCM 31913 / LMG 7466 / NCTC 11488 / FDC 602W) TaxID=273121 RepID=Q7MR43_WOLSU|nr:helix-turn-helix transcriptional regulator [Wolinella succinogenes]NLU34689.1 helix-turn-helix transcriptional regulator [Wolinella succinogenes]CAE10759.1 hypothetical protein WS1734 [Wolinella succinogenes]VEG80910.1 Uncharacterised protein [Wolinella succinogenes]HCZ18563.1 XRE family transcriptional regulator [Helicobacter sp.]